MGIRRARCHAPYHNIADRVKSLSTLGYFAGFGSQLYERPARLLECEHGRRESEPGGIAAGPQIDALRIDAGHPPVSRAAAEQIARVGGNGIGVVCVHVPQDFRFRRRQSNMVVRKQEVAAIDPVDAAETRDKMPAFGRRSIEPEIGERRVDRARRMVRNEAVEKAGIGDGLGPSD
jgi:hypothetical protein